MLTLFYMYKYMLKNQKRRIFMQKKIIIICSALITHYAATSALQEHLYTQQAYEHRYNVIKPLLNRYTRPITILELGAHNNNALSFSIAQEYDAACVIAESDYVHDVLNICNARNDKNIILLSKKLSLDDLQRLSECEHFDVILAFDIIRLFKPKWKEAINILLKSADHIIIESPSEQIEKYLSKNTRTMLTQSHYQDSHEIGSLFLFNKYKKYLSRRWWNYPYYEIGSYTVFSNFQEKKLIKIQQELVITPWNTGINLLTFKELQGIYPSKKVIIELLEPLKNIDHTSLHIHNIIIQGNNLVPIDYSHKPHERHLIPQAVEKIINQFKMCNIKKSIQNEKNNYYIRPIKCRLFLSSSSKESTV